MSRLMCARDSEARLTAIADPQSAAIRAQLPAMGQDNDSVRIFSSAAEMHGLPLFLEKRVGGNSHVSRDRVLAAEMRR